MTSRKRAPRIPKLPKTYSETARILGDLRAALGLSQGEYAKLLGMSQPLISKLEAGTMPPSLKAWQRAYQEGLRADEWEITAAMDGFMENGRI